MRGQRAESRMAEAVRCRGGQTTASPSWRCDCLGGSRNSPMAGPSRETARLLDALADELRGKARPQDDDRRSPASRSPGTRLVREWAGSRAHYYRPARRLRIRGPEIQVAVGHRPRHHRHALEWLAVLRPPGNRKRRSMKNQAGSVLVMPRRLRCAVYTRKSSEEGLDKEFNSLDAQREACRVLYRQPEGRGLGDAARRPTTMAAFSGGTLGTAGGCSACWPTSKPGWSMWSSSTRSTACPAL